MRMVILFPLMYPCGSEMHFDPRDVVSPAARPQLALQGTFFSFEDLCKGPKCWSQLGDDDLNILETDLPLKLGISPQKFRVNDLCFHFVSTCTKLPCFPICISNVSECKSVWSRVSSHDSPESQLKLWSLHEKWVGKNHNTHGLVWVVLSQVFIVGFVLKLNQSFDTHLLKWFLSKRLLVLNPRL